MTTTPLPDTGRHVHTSTPAELPAGAVVVALDGSPHAERALDWGSDQARREGRPLVLAHAAGSDLATANTWLVPAVPVVDLLADVRAEAARMLAEAADGVLAKQPGLRVVTVAVDDDARHLLLELAERAHLLVLGSRGRGVVRSLLLGSVSAVVARHAACPVVVTRPRGDTASPTGVLVGIDGGEGSAQVAEAAFRLASFRGQSLTVVHCYWDVTAAYLAARPARRPEPATDTVQLADLEATVSATLAGLGEKFPDVEVEVRLEHGLVDQVLADHAAAWDVVVVGRHHRSGWEHLLGHSISSAVLERARGTVAVVPLDDVRGGASRV